MQAPMFGETILLFPTHVEYLEHPARTAEVIESARHVGLHSIYVLITDIPKGKKTSTIWNLRAICVRLNVRYTVVSSKTNQVLVYVSLFNQTIEWEKEVLASG